MKPRNTFEKEVIAQSAKVRRISKAEQDWAFRNCIDHYAYRLPKGRTTCMDCGHSWVMEQQTETCTCPNCKAKLQVRLTYERKIQQKQYFTILTTSGKYQILRMLLLISEMEKGCRAKSYVLEIGHYWWNAQGQKAVVAIQRVYGRYLDTFSFASPLAIRNDNEVYQHIANTPIYPKFKATDILARNGFKDDFHDISPTMLISALLTDSKAETLQKAGQYAMLRHYLYCPFNMERYWASVKICIRNGYTIKDGSMWCDMIDLLQHFGKDTNNPKYVCPSDLKAEHDKLVRKRTRQREKELFLRLTSVSGVGAKLAISILSAMRPEELSDVIAAADAKRLSSVKGVGKKTADRIILELHGKISADALIGAGEGILRAEIVSREEEDAAAALAGLGFSRQEVSRAVQKAKEQGAQTAEELIAAALKEM